MKTKLVLWGLNEKEERVLIAMRLRPLENIVDLWTFPENVATEEFSKQLMNDWRNDVDVEFPEGNSHLERALSVSDSLLPDTLKVERGDIVNRAQTEWHFIVLSAKLNEAYQSELNELKERVDQLTAFDSPTWESLKSFWAKVQSQVRDRNLFRDHANHLRDNTNALFSRLKELRASLDAEFQGFSKEHFESFNGYLEDIEKRVVDGMNLTVIFDELKNLQRKFRDTKFTREHRSKIWERLDGAFKTVKEKRFGSNAHNENSPMERLQRRYAGLINAISKMEKSIKRDEEDLAFQDHRVANTDGQLEAQLRQAKVNMIKERISSKQEKLGEMQQTKTELEQRIASQNEKDKKKAEIESAKAAAKEKIVAEMEAAKEARSDDEEKLEKAAESIKKKIVPPVVKESESMVTENIIAEASDTAITIANLTSDKTENTLGGQAKGKDEEE